ncbi:uncharacterized protein LOC132741873 [Ruditapes philippinarum]|uniref:uncharacterized protein LOC132741873 n=1 Tax=Ruditapes philippinarum TaxID=129788 RepID=UPI00295C1ED0|nr:uncharacterized protein LOC132741873 [Ruditapes philippinarum]
MNRLSRNDYKAHSRMDKVCSSKRARSICGTHRGHDFRRQPTNRRKVEDKTSQKKRRSKSALPPQSRRRSMPQKQSQVGQRKRRATGHNSSRTERRKDSAFELKMYLDECYDYMQHTNRNDVDIPKDPASERQSTKVSEDVFCLKNPDFKRDTREADEIHCHSAKQQTSGDQTVKSTKHGNLDMSITDICPKTQATNTRQISEKLLQDDIRNELSCKRKTKKGLFTNVFRRVLACFDIRNDRK